MHELVRSNDLVLLGAIEALLGLDVALVEDAGERVHIEGERDEEIREAGKPKETRGFCFLGASRRSCPPC